MLQTIAIILIILWLLGYVTANTMGGFIHVLLVIAIILILVRIISGRKPLVIASLPLMTATNIAGSSMNKTMSLALLAGGIVLLVFGYQRRAVHQFRILANVSHRLAHEQGDLDDCRRHGGLRGRRLGGCHRGKITCKRA